MTNNPWRLTPAQIDAMDALVQHRFAKRAASRLGLTKSAFDERIKIAKRKMGFRNQGVFAHILEFDRWRQANKEQA